MSNLCNLWSFSLIYVLLFLYFTFVLPATTTHAYALRATILSFRFSDQLCLFTWNGTERVVLLFWNRAVLLEVVPYERNPWVCHLLEWNELRSHVNGTFLFPVDALLLNPRFLFLCFSLKPSILISVRLVQNGSKTRRRKRREKIRSWFAQCTNTDAVTRSKRCWFRCYCITIGKTYGKRWILRLRQTRETRRSSG